MNGFGGERGVKGGKVSGKGYGRGEELYECDRGGGWKGLGGGEGDGGKCRDDDDEEREGKYC